MRVPEAPPSITFLNHLTPPPYAPRSTLTLAQFAGSNTQIEAIQLGPQAAATETAPHTELTRNSLWADLVTANQVGRVPVETWPTWDGPIYSGSTYGIGEVHASQAHHPHACASHPHARVLHACLLSLPTIHLAAASLSARVCLTSPSPRSLARPPPFINAPTPPRSHHPHSPIAGQPHRALLWPHRAAEVALHYGDDRELRTFSGTLLPCTRRCSRVP